MKCEICDRDPRIVFEMRGRFEPIAGSGKGWSVPFMPPMPESFLDFPAKIPCTLVGYVIDTCGTAVCMWRARHHGVPGYAYTDGQ